MLMIYSTSERNAVCVFGQRHVEPRIRAMLHVQMGDGNGDVGKGSFAIGRLWQFVGAQALTVSKTRPRHWP